MTVCKIYSKARRDAPCARILNRHISWHIYAGLPAKTYSSEKSINYCVMQSGK